VMLHISVKTRHVERKRSKWTVDYVAIYVPELIRMRPIVTSRARVAVTITWSRTLLPIHLTLTNPATPLQ
jgi:hypothetical protein